MQAFEGSSVKFLKKQKQWIEMRLGKALYDCFADDDELIWPLRYFVYMLMRKVEKLGESENQGFAQHFRMKLSTVFEKEKNLAVWNHGTGVVPYWGKFEKIMDEAAEWTPNDCSDLIRLYGEVVETLGNEKVLGIIAQCNNPWEAANLRSDTALALWKEYGSWKEFALEKKKYREFPEFKTERKRTGRPTGYIVKAPTQRRLHPDVKKPGFCRWKLESGDTTKSIADLFGLYEGGSISGTTADTIYSLDFAHKQYDKNTKVARNLFLVPFATMVWNGHHTILEIALALQLAVNEFHQEERSYSVDSYSDLVPPYDQSAHLKATLSQYESLVDDFHLIVVRNKKGDEKAYRMEMPEEKKAFKKFANLTKNIDKFKSLAIQKNAPSYKTTLLKTLGDAGLLGFPVADSAKSTQPMDQSRQWKFEHRTTMKESIEEFLPA